MSLNLDEELRRHFGFPSFRPGQREAVEHVLAGRDTLVVMPTGSGKSLCYQLPALLDDPSKRPGVVVVVSPLIALMKDQVDALIAKDPTHATYINSSLGYAEQQERIAAIRRQTHRLLYVAPERFRSASFLTAIESVPVSLFVIDEAHCISEWGHDFRPDYLNLGAAIERLKQPPVLALTATATRRVQDDIVRQLNLPRAQRIVTGFDRPNLSFEVVYIPTTEAKRKAGRANDGDYGSEAACNPTTKAKLSKVHGLLTEDSHRDSCGLIYVGTRRDAEEVAEFVKTTCKLKTDFYHGGLGDEFRRRAHDAFLTEKVKVFVATKAFGMGIDKPNIRFVIHFSIPDSVESYYQEAGRSGRDGAPSRCVLLYSPEDRALQEYFIANSELTQDELSSLFSSILAISNKGERPVSPSRLEQELDRDQIAVRVGISELEKVGALRRKVDQSDPSLDIGFGGAMTFEILTGDLSALTLRKANNNMRRRIEERKHRLNGIIRYAEGNGCRRRFILDYFGDRGEAAATHDCCDNCTSRGRTTQAVDAEPMDYLILQCVEGLTFPLGHGKLIGLLRGSKARWVRQWHIEKNPYYGRLQHFKAASVETRLDFLLKHGYLKTIGGRMPTLMVTPLGQNIAARPLTEPIEAPAPVPKPKPRPTSRPHSTPGGGPFTHWRQLATRTDPLPQTLQETLTLFRQGKRAPQIAKERELAVSTIADHLIELVAAGMVQVEELVKPGIRETIESVLQGDAVRSLKDIKDRLPETINYPQIKCVVAAWLREHPEWPEDEAACAARGQPETAPPSPNSDDIVRAYLSTPHPRPLTGPWDAGFALDFTGSFQGAQYVRSDVGEEVFQLKYRGQRAMAERIAARMKQFLEGHPELGKADILLTVPPTVRGRTVDPVEEIAAMVSRQTGIPLEYLVARVRNRRPQKEIQSEAAKRENVRGAFQITDLDCVRGKRILLIDDFYDSGATLSECVRVLRSAGPRFIGVLTAGKTVHHG